MRPVNLTDNSTEAGIPSPCRPATRTIRALKAIVAYPGLTAQGGLMSEHT
jgi:hypothetical protein